MWRILLCQLRNKLSHKTFPVKIPATVYDRGSFPRNITKCYLVHCCVQTASTACLVSAHWTSRDLSLTMKRSEHKVDISLPFSTLINNLWRCTPASLLLLHYTTFRHKNNFQLQCDFVCQLSGLSHVTEISYLESQNHIDLHTISETCTFVPKYIQIPHKFFAPRVHLINIQSVNEICEQILGMIFTYQNKKSCPVQHMSGNINILVMAESVRL